MHLNFMTVDVFTDTRFGGNPLAVVMGGDTLTTQQMQTVAAEFNLSETTFILKAKDASHSANVRIFTPRAELPFAGHPNIGTAWVLAHFGNTMEIEPNEGAFIFEEKAGLVPIKLIEQNGTVCGASLKAPAAFTTGHEIPTQVVAEACSLNESAIHTQAHKPIGVSCGNPFNFARVMTREDLAEAVPRAEVFKQRMPADTATGLMLYCTDASGVVHARMFAPLQGIEEDPATGSAGVGLVGLLAKLSPENDLDLSVRIEQGRDMGRTSHLDAFATKRDGVVIETGIGGNCVGVMSGTLSI